MFSASPPLTRGQGDQVHEVAVFKEDLLDGLFIIETKGVNGDGNPVNLTAISCYAMAKRGETPMIMWLPL